MPGQRRPLEERFWAKVNKTDSCWLWTAALRSGYGVIGVGGARKKGGRILYAHRISYELNVGPIPEGLHIDHLCHGWDENCLGGECVHRRCVNPNHLEPVTKRVNDERGRSLWAINARKTHCPRGHPFSGDNLWVSPDGVHRVCRECSRERETRRARTRLSRAR